MPISDSRHTEKRQYHGEYLSEKVVDFLNGLILDDSGRDRHDNRPSPKIIAKMKEARKRVIPILEMLTQIFGSGNQSNFDKLNRLLSQYKVYSQVKVGLDLALDRRTLFFTEVPFRGHMTTAE